MSGICDLGENKHWWTKNKRKAKIPLHALEALWKVPLIRPETESETEAIKTMLRGRDGGRRRTSKRKIDEEVKMDGWDDAGGDGRWIKVGMMGVPGVSVGASELRSTSVLRVFPSSGGGNNGKSLLKCELKRNGESLTGALLLVAGSNLLPGALAGVTLRP